MKETCPIFSPRGACLIPQNPPVSPDQCLAGVWGLLLLFLLRRLFLNQTKAVWHRRELTSSLSATIIAGEDKRGRRVLLKTEHGHVPVPCRIHFIPHCPGFRLMGLKVLRIQSPRSPTH